MTLNARRGLSLTEVLVVLVILAVIIALLLPAFCRVRYASERMQCSNNLKQLMISAEQYESTGRQGAETPAGQSNAPTVNLFPPGCVGPGGTPEERLSWVVTLLPYLEQGSLYRQFDMNLGYAGNLPASQTGLKVLLCPKANLALTDATIHYVAMAGIGADAASRPVGEVGNGFMGYDRQTSATAIRDGLSNTIALIETRSNLGPWARGGTSTVRGFDPGDVPWSGERRPFGGIHSDGIQLAMADGSVRFIQSRIDSKQLAAAITIAGGETIGLD